MDNASVTIATRRCSLFLTFCKVAHIHCVCMVAGLNLIFTSAQKTRGVRAERLKMPREVPPADEKPPKVPPGLDNTWGEYILLERAGEGGKVSHQTASVVLNTDAEHICQITGLKIDTLTTDRQLHTLQQRTTKQMHFKHADDSECRTTPSLLLKWEGQSLGNFAPNSPRSSETQNV